ncbi:MAG: CotH kinase family protein [Janthinobacterium lividum]
MPAVKQSHAQGIVLVDPTFVHVDSVKKIVLINAPLHLLNAASPARDSTRILAVGSRQYKLARAVAALSAAAMYKATSQAATYTVYVTQVPVMKFTTRYQIVDTPSVYAHFVLLDSTGVLAQSGTGIEFRGAYSQTFPKKSYELSLWADTLGATDNDLPLLGMRDDNKWNLQALYNDQLRLRMKVANELWQEIDQVYYQAKEPDAKNGIDMAYTEVFINDSYQGIYALTERIDRKQLKLKKYANNTIMGELYKGTTADVADAFASAPAFNNNSLSWGGFEYKEPSEQTDWTNLHDFVDFVATSPDSVFYAQYQSRLDLANAVDYYLFLNLMRATDNTGKNIYVAKYKPGEPYYYAPWDLDGVLGNDWSGTNVNITNDLLTNGLYTRLLNDYSAAGFREALVKRWASLRTSIITEAHIKAEIDANSAYLLRSNVYEREHQAWPEYAYDAAQLTYPDNWLVARIAYLDGIFSAATMGTAGATEAEAMQVFPNPASGYLSVVFKAGPCQLSIQDMQGRQVLQTTLLETYTTLDISALPKGLYLAHLKSPTATVTKKLVVN